MVSETKGNNNSLTVEQTHTDDVSLKELILKVRGGVVYILSRWLLIMAVGAIGCILGITYGYLKNTQYVATTTFVLEESNSGGSGLGQYAGIASMVGIDLGNAGGGGIFQGDNLIELYKSHEIIEKTLLSNFSASKNQLLIDKYIEFNKLREKWQDKPLLKNIQFKLSGNQEFSRIQDSIINDVVFDINKSYLAVSKPDKKLGIIEVKVTSIDEAFSKSFNEQIVENVNNFYIQTKTKKSLQNLSILQHQTDSIRAALNGAIYNVATSIDANPNANISRQILRVPSQKRQIDAEANKAILTQLVQNLEISKVSLRKETPLIQLIDKPILPLEKVRLGKVKAGIIGSFAFAFATVFVLLIGGIYKKIMI